MARRKDGQAAVIFLAAIILAVALFSIGQQSQVMISEGIITEIISAYHVHADFLVIINDVAIDFERQEFDYVNPAIHLHVQNYRGGSVLHVESRDATLGDFFTSMGMSFNSECFYIGNSRQCDTETHSVKFYVNGALNSEHENYKPNDLDRILISYGPKGEDVKGQNDAVTNLACIFSRKCDVPEEAEGRIYYN